MLLVSLHPKRALEITEESRPTETLPWRVPRHQTSAKAQRRTMIFPIQNHKTPKERSGQGSKTSPWGATASGDKELSHSLPGRKPWHVPLNETSPNRVNLLVNPWWTDAKAMGLFECCCYSNSSGEAKSLGSSSCSSRSSQLWQEPSPKSLRKRQKFFRKTLSGSRNHGLPLPCHSLPLVLPCTVNLRWNTREADLPF